MVRRRATQEEKTGSAPTVHDETTTEFVKRLLHWDELEDWQKDNEYIHTGYVRSENSYRAVLRSLGYIHNETGNIYSHLIPSICVLMLVVVVVVSNEHSMPFLAFYLGCMICLGISAGFHSFKSHSHRVAKIGNKLDYLGICILIAASMVALLSFAYNDKPVQYAAFVGLTLALCVACSAVSLLERFRSREFRSTRATMFVCYGLSGVLPVLVGALEFGYSEISKRAACPWLYAEAFFYIFGAALYALRFPEKCMPGQFDIVGHSHQIFHFFVVIAAWCHYTALKEARDHAWQRAASPFL